MPTKQFTITVQNTVLNGVAAWDASALGIKERGKNLNETLATLSQKLYERRRDLERAKELLSLEGAKILSELQEALG